MAPDLAHALAEEKKSFTRDSTADRLATVLRDMIFTGGARPGQRLAEDDIREGLGVSRNTIREAFRLLSHERLLEYHFGRGVFVAKPTTGDVADLYRARRAVELAAIREAGTADAEELAPLIDRVGAAVDHGHRALDAEDWGDLGTANMEFHAAIAALAQSRRVNSVMSQLLAEMRLVFQVMSSDSNKRFHEPYLAGNRKIHDLLRAGDFTSAERHLSEYLHEAEVRIIAEFDQLRAD